MYNNTRKPNSTNELFKMEEKTMKLFQKMIALVMALCLVCAAGMALAEDTLVDKIKAKGVLVVGTEATYPPYEYIDDDGNFAGCDIWLAEQIAAALGVKLEMQDMAFDGIIPAVQSGMVDMGLAAFTITEERAQVIDFTNQYEKSAQLLIVKAGNADTYSTKEALAGQKVGAQLGTIQSELVVKALPDSELFELAKYPDLALETKNGNIAGFVVDYAVGMSLVEQSEGALEVANFAFSDEEASFGKAGIVAKGNDAFMEIVYQVIDQAVVDGSYQAAYDAAVAATGATGD